MEPKPHAPGRASAARREPGSAHLKSPLTDLLIVALPILINIIRDQFVQSGQPVYGTRLTLEDAFQFFEENKGQSPLAASGAIVRSADQDGTWIFLIFLDRDGTPLITGPMAAPVGSYLIQALDPELAAAFGSKNVIVIN